MPTVNSPIVISEFDILTDLVVFEVDARDLPRDIALSTLRRILTITPDAATLSSTVTLTLHAPPHANLPHANLPHHDRPYSDLAQQVLHRTVHLSGVPAIGPEHIRLRFLTQPLAATSAPPPQRDTATLTGAGLYPQTAATPTEPADPAAPRRVVLDQDWRAHGPPEELFFDLSTPRASLSVTIAPNGSETGRDHSLYYAIRFFEDRTTPDSFERQASLVIVQTAPGLPRLTPPQLARLFPARLGHRAVRAVAWIWLGNKGRYRDPETGGWRPFGAINRKPRLHLSGPITFEMEMRHTSTPHDAPPKDEPARPL